MQRKRGWGFEGKRGEREIQKRRLNRKGETEKKFAIIFKKQGKNPKQVTRDFVLPNPSLDNQAISNKEEKMEKKSPLNASEIH